MCFVPRNVYTVCAHSRVGEVVECGRQKVRNGQYQDGGWCANFKLTLRSCRPVEITKLKYWFCEECREYFRDHDTNTADAILKYWSFKSLRGYSYCVSPKLVPSDLVFNGEAAAVNDPTKPRCELIALDKAWPRKPFETRVDWLQRLEKARTMTLELAGKWNWSHTRARRESGEAANNNNDVVGMQPRMSSPMSVYPYARALSAITELSDSQGTNKSLPPLPPLYDNTQAAPQVHLETLQRLCGATPSGLLPPRAGESPKPKTAGPEQPETPLVARASSPVGHEVDQDSYDASVPPLRLLTSRLTRPFDQPRGDLVGSETASPESFNEGSGEAVEGIRVDHPDDPSRLSQNSPDKGLEPSPPADCVLDNNESADGSLGGDTLSNEEDDSDEPNMTSHFSVSSIDPDDAAELVSLDLVRPISEDFALDDTSTDATSVTEAEEQHIPELMAEEEEHKSDGASSPAPEIVAPQPHRLSGPPRFVLEDEVPGTEQPGSDEPSEERG
jgi:hypothetical protein